MPDDGLEEVRAVEQDDDGLEEGGSSDRPPITDVIVAVEGPGYGGSYKVPVIDQFIKAPLAAYLRIEAHDGVDGRVHPVNQLSSGNLAILEYLGDLILKIGGEGIRQVGLVNEIGKELPKGMFLGGTWIIDQGVLHDCFRNEMELCCVPVEPVRNLKYKLIRLNRDSIQLDEPLHDMRHCHE